MEKTSRKSKLFDGKKSVHSLGSGDSQYICHFVPDAENIMEKVIKEVEFLPRDSFMFSIYGKSFQLPRDKQFYGDIEEDGTWFLYRYGGSYVPTVNPWTPTLKTLREKVNKDLGQYCNHAVVNRYRNGNDHIGLHKDKSKDFVESSKVFTLSLGIPRLFRLKHIQDGTIQEIILQPGSVFELGPKTNEEWKHSIVKCSANEVKDTRISITLRSIATKYDPKSKKTIEAKNKKKRKIKADTKRESKKMKADDGMESDEISESKQNEESEDVE